MARSKRYQDIATKIEKDKLYSIDEAIGLLKETSTTKFDGSVELHIRLGIDISKSDQQVRGTASLPHGTGKSIKVAAFVPEKIQEKAKNAGAEIVGGEDLIKEIKQSGKIDFDVAVSTPDMMKFMAQIAKILGPKGIMPSPKNETVTNDIEKAIQEVKKGKINFKNDATANLHLMAGKVSFAPEQLKENIEILLSAIKKAKPASSKGTYIKKAYINASMGPAIPISIMQ